MRGNRRLRRWATGTTAICVLALVTPPLVGWIAGWFGCELPLGTTPAPCRLPAGTVGLLRAIAVVPTLLLPFTLVLAGIAALLWVLWAASARLDPGPDRL